MKLFTKEIEKKLQAQFYRGDDCDQLVQCKIFNPYGRGTWYIMNQDPNDPDYLWAIVDLFEVEEGSVSKSELENCRIKVGGCELKLERDLSWKPKTAWEVWDQLQNRAEAPEARMALGCSLSQRARRRSLKTPLTPCRPASSSGRMI